MKKKPKPNPKHFWKNCPSPNSRTRKYVCPDCGYLKEKTRDCVVCGALKYRRVNGLPPTVLGGASDSHGRETRKLNTMVGVSN